MANLSITVRNVGAPEQAKTQALIVLLPERVLIERALFQACLLPLCIIERVAEFMKNIDNRLARSCGALIAAPLKDVIVLCPAQFAGPHDVIQGSPMAGPGKR